MNITPRADSKKDAPGFQDGSKALAVPCTQRGSPEG